jgi:hypothetical protein
MFRAADLRGHGESSMCWVSITHTDVVKSTPADAGAQLLNIRCQALMIMGLTGEIGYPAVTIDLLARPLGVAPPSLYKQPREGSEFNVNRRSSPMSEDGWLTGGGMATAVYNVPAVERIHAPLPAALWARSRLPAALIVLAITPIVRGRSPAGAVARGDDPLNQEGSPMQVPVTGEPPAGRFTACVART